MAYSPSGLSSSSARLSDDQTMMRTSPSSSGLAPPPARGSVSPAAGTPAQQYTGSPSLANPPGAGGGGGGQSMRRGFSYDSNPTSFQPHPHHPSLAPQQQQQQPQPRPPPLQTSGNLPASFHSPSTSSRSGQLSTSTYSPRPMSGVHLHHSHSLSSSASTSASNASPRLPPHHPQQQHYPHQGGGAGGGAGRGPSGSPLPGSLIGRSYSPSHYAASSGPSSATSIPPPPLSSAYRSSMGSSVAPPPPPPPASSFYPQHIAQAYTSTGSSGAGAEGPTPGNPAAGGGGGLSTSPLAGSAATALSARDRERERLGGASTPAHHPHPQQYYQSSQYLGGSGSAASAGGPPHHHHQHQQQGHSQSHGQHAQQQQQRHGPQQQPPQQHPQQQHQQSASYPSNNNPSSTTSATPSDLRSLSLSRPTPSAGASGSGSASASGMRRKGLQRVRDVRDIRRGGAAGATAASGGGGGGAGGGLGGGDGPGQGGQGHGHGHGGVQPRGRRADPMGGWVSPLKALTLTLPSTYSLVNPGFAYESTRNPRRVLTKPSKPANNDGFDNEDSDYILYVNDVLGPEEKDRYLILDVLGQGTFGQVVKCQNLKTHEIVAVKVVKNKPAYFQQSMMEVTILELINNQWDKEDDHHMLRLKDTFIHHSHLCLVFELLSNNLYELIKQNSFRGLSTSLVRVFTAQLLDALSVLNEATLIHCDLKPENILLKSLQSPTIKVIDFGSACHEKQTVYTYIQSRFYRSPEVILSLPYSSMIDMWSLGCICVELFLGLPLFPGTSEFNQITRIVEMLGMPPDAMLDKGKQTSHFFDSVPDEYGRRRWKLKSLERYAQEYKANEQPSKKYFSATTLPDIIKQYPIVRKGLKEAEVDKEMRNRIAFIDFVQGLLHLDPEQRWSPQQARLHPFVLGEPLLAPFVPPPRHIAAGFGKRESPTSGSVGSTAAGAGAGAGAGTASRQSQTGYVASPQMSSQSSQGCRRGYESKGYQPPHLSPQQQQQQQQGYALQHQQQQQQQQQQQLAAAQAAAAMQQQQQQQIAAAQAQAAFAQQQARQAAAQPSLYGAAAGGFAPRSAPIPSGVAGSSAASSSGLGVLANPQRAYGAPGAGVGLGGGLGGSGGGGGGRGRSGTLGEGGMGGGGLPPALQKLGHELLAGQGAGQSVTPVLRRDDQWQAWEQQYAGGNGVQRRISISTRNPHLNLLQEQAESGLNSWNSPARQKPHHPHSSYGGGGGGAGGYYTSPMQGSQPQFSVVVDPSRPSGGGSDLFDSASALAAPPLAYAGSSRYAPYPSSSSSAAAAAAAMGVLGGAPAPPPGAAAPLSSSMSGLVDSNSTSPFDTLSHHSPHLGGGGGGGGGGDALGGYQPMQPYASPNMGGGGRGGGGPGPGPPGLYSPNVPQQGGKPKGLW
ncbi:hypothetical protein JCM11641_005908 [Rhodosporidiobolus odoratus]